MVIMSLIGHVYRCDWPGCREWVEVALELHAVPAHDGDLRAFGRWEHRGFVHHVCPAHRSRTEDELLRALAESGRSEGGRSDPAPVRLFDPIAIDPALVEQRLLAYAAAVAAFWRDHGADPSTHVLVVYPALPDPTPSARGPAVAAPLAPDRDLLHVLIPRADLEALDRYPSRSAALGLYPHRTIDQLSGRVRPG
jgi:hypothetical protein